MHKIYSIIFTIILISSQFNSIAQQEKVWFSGLARSYFVRDANSFENDSTSAKNSSLGYNLIDLNTHINPLKDIEIFAQLRISNEFGSFFGTGTDIVVRQLTAKGVLAKKIKFSIGDLFLKQNKFTLNNNNEELPFFNSGFSSTYRDIIHYENFYLDNRWRLQGLQTNFSYEFDRFIETIEFDFFITRPRGSSSIGNGVTQSDMLLAGGTMKSKIFKNLTFESNYINLFEVTSTGNTGISVRNPVLQGGLTYQNETSNAILKHNIQSGFSKRSWLQFDSLVINQSIGMFSELSTSYFKIDSSFSFSIGGRYVDPNFRSSGSQTRRIDMREDNNNSIYPNYSNEQISRPITAFDIVTDATIYNQDLSPTLMNFNPMYSNSLPYGDATPNRVGVFTNLDFQTENKFLKLNFNSSYLQEVIGQGSYELRNFLFIYGKSNFNLHEVLNLKKKLIFSLSFINETTKRAGTESEKIDLSSKHLDFSSDIEMLKNIFLQLGLKQVNSSGNEFLTDRIEYGEILTFNKLFFNQKDNLYSIGLKYKFRPKVYMNLQYNWWGTNFNDVNISDFKYQRLLFIFSVKL